MIEAVRIDVCVCTYNRPQKLKECIQSLIAQETNGTAELRIIIVDNDQKQTGRYIAESIAASSAVPIIYLNEDHRGISYARNKCLDAIDADYFCFIDDDEIAPPHWIKSLYQALNNYSVAVVSGPVIATYPENTPRWVIESKVFERPRRSSGEILKSVATGNCIIKTSVIRSSGIRFDHKFALSGGEDSDFFSRLLSCGYKAVYCNEAEVFEEAAPNRMTVNYWMRRAIRGGQTYAITNYTGMNNIKKFALACKKTSHLIFGACMIILSLPFGRARYINWIIRAASSYGQLSGLRGKILETYR